MNQTEGFSFDLCSRNSLLESKGISPPKVTKTGTTIVGLIYKDGVVLGADTRSTSGHVVADPNCEKIHHIVDNISCCGAGTAADTENVTMTLSAKLQFHELESGTQARVVSAVTMLRHMLFPYRGHVSAALVLGGFDINGPQLHMIYPHGSSDELPYTTMGSGSTAAMAILEHNYRPEMEKEEAMQLVIAAVKSGIFNDLGSGSNVDIAVITKFGREMFRNIEKPNPRPQLRRDYSFASGTTVVTSTKVIDLDTSQKEHISSFLDEQQNMDSQ